MRMLLKADDELVPKFFNALTENGQPHVARMLQVTYFFLWASSVNGCKKNSVAVINLNICVMHIEIACSIMFLLLLEILSICHVCILVSEDLNTYAVLYLFHMIYKAMFKARDIYFITSYAENLSTIE